MKRNPLGRTGFDVPEICLGTMTWGAQNTEAEAHEQLDYALSRGINFLDTAELYAVPPSPETQGLTDIYIGNWMKARGNREDIFLASKVVGPSPHLTWIRDGTSRLNRHHIMASIDAGLKRLQTDRIDLFQLHWPDRRAPRFGALDAWGAEPDPDEVPLEETFRALEEAVASGKVRYVGLSNDTPWGVMKALALADAAGLPRPVTVQNPYNLLNREYERGLAEISLRERCGLLAYSPLAGGTLSGKYLNGALPAGSRRAIDSRGSRYANPQGDAATAAYVKIAADAGLDPCQMAIAFCLRQPFMTSAIIGATSMEQLKINIAAASVKLSDDVIEAIETVHRKSPDPCP